MNVSVLVICPPLAVRERMVSCLSPFFSFLGITYCQLPRESAVTVVNTLSGVMLISSSAIGSLVPERVIMGLVSFLLL